MTGVLCIVSNRSFIRDENDVSIVDSQSQFDQINWADAEVYKNGIILEAELNWNCQFSEFYGFEIIRKIRQEYKIKSVIIICSALPEAYFSGEKSPLICRIVNAPSHYYIEIDPNINHITKALELLNAEDEDGEKNCIELDEMTLDDVNSTFYEKSVYVGNILHDLKNKSCNIYFSDIINVTDISYSFIHTYFEKIAHVIEENKITNLKGIENEIKNIISKEYHKIYEDKTITDEKKIENIQSIFYKIIDQFGKRIKGLVPSNKKRDNSQAEKQLWEVLYIEDIKNQRDRMISLFSEKGVKCYTAANYKEAKVILKDEKYKIAVVISDLRIYKEEGSPKFDDYQGYKVIEKIRSISQHPIAYFMLTTKENTIKCQAGIPSKDRILWYSKDDVIFSEGGFNIFFREVVIAAKNSFAQNLFQPKKTSWIKPTARFDKPLGEYYKLHCESVDHDDAEAIINENAHSYIKNALNNNIEELPEIAWTTKIESKNKVEEEKNKEDLDSFRRYILTGRRIVLGLAYKNENENDIFKYLYCPSHKDLIEEFQKNRERLIRDYNNDYKQIMQTHFCFSTKPSKDIPILEDIKLKKFSDIVILLEEIDFLHNNFNFSYSATQVKQLLSASSALIELCGNIREYINMNTGGRLLPESFQDFEDKLLYGDDFSMDEIKKAFNDCTELAKDTSNRLNNSEMMKIIDKHVDSISENDIKDFLVSISE